ncbi:uncharacterized protein TNCV_2439591 [Trichonephila clavipes]|nr:uncharacterized protein TNCV_2439591 [Trichonephila clavipes]
MKTTSYRSRSGVGVRHFFCRGTTFPSRCTRNDDNDILPQPSAVVTFFRRGTLAVRSSWCTRNDDNDILPQPLGGGCSSLFSSRHYSAVRSRLGARGTMTTTSYRSPAVGVRHVFFVEALFCPVKSWCTRNDDIDILPQPRGGRCSSPFFRRGTTLLSGRVFLHAER